MATANNAKNLTNQYGDATHFYGNGVNATRGQNNNVFYLERRAIEQATTNKVFSQFASRYDMPQHTGREFRVSVSYNSYDRFPFMLLGMIGQDKNGLMLLLSMGLWLNEMLLMFQDKCLVNKVKM